MNTASPPTIKSGMGIHPQQTQPLVRIVPRWLTCIRSIAALSFLLKMTVSVRRSRSRTVDLRPTPGTPVTEKPRNMPQDQVLIYKACAVPHFPTARKPLTVRTSLQAGRKANTSALIRPRFGLLTARLCYTGGWVLITTYHNASCHPDTKGRRTDEHRHQPL